MILPDKTKKRKKQLLLPLLYGQDRRFIHERKIKFIISSNKTPGDSAEYEQRIWDTDSPFVYGFSGRGGPDRMKKILTGSLAVLLLICFLVTGAMAEEPAVFPVTLKAGTGTGDDIVLDQADPALLAEDWEKAKPGQFFVSEKDTYLRLPDVPKGFEAPEGSVFFGWKIMSGEEEEEADTSLQEAAGFWIRIEEETVLTAVWGEEAASALRSVKLSLEAPLCGTEVKTEKKTGQEPSPEILIPSDAQYQVDARWVTLPPEGEEELFSGTMEGEQNYYAEIVLSGTDFAHNVKIQLKGGEVYASAVREEERNGELRILVKTAAAHTPGETVIENEKEASCSEEGAYDEVVCCTACEKELSRNTIKVEKPAHTPGETVIENEKEASCAEEGGYDEVIYCEVCGEEISRVNTPIEKLEHTPGETVIENKKEASCAEEGGYDEVVTCSACQEELSRKTVRTPKLDHTPADAVREKEKAATCGEEGSYDEVIRCSVCGEILSSKTVKTPKTEHSWGEPSYDWAADFSSVTAKRVCSKDPSHVETEKVPTSSVEEKATCLKGGVMTYTASFQNPAFSQQSRQKVTTAATGHKWGEWKVVTAATTSAEGLEARVCANDSTHVETRVIPKKAQSSSGSSSGSGYSTSTQHVHSWNAPTFSWKADFSGATVTFVCKSNKNHTQRAEATVKTETILPSGSTDGKTVYTATVIFEGKSWTETKEIAIRAAGSTGYSSGSFSGSWTKGSNEVAEIRISRWENNELTEKLFQGVSIDGKELAAGQYALGRDGTLRLQPAYLATLEPGTHTVTVSFADGSSETNLQIKAASAAENTPLPEKTEQEQEPEKPANGKTEKESSGNLFWWIAVPVTAGAALAAVLVIARKKKKAS